MKKIFFAALAVCLISTCAFAEKAVLKGGFSFGTSFVYTDSSAWKDGLMSSGHGPGFYLGADFLTRNTACFYLDTAFSFNDRFKYDGERMSGQAFYLTSNTAFGVSFYLKNTEKFRAYVGCGLSLCFQSLEKAEDADYYKTTGTYAAFGVNIKFGLMFFPTKIFGFDISVNDSLCPLTLARNVQVGNKKYVLAKSGVTSVANFCNVNIALALKF